MTQVGFTGRKITNEKLDKKIIRKGGMQIIDMSTIKTNQASEHESLKVEFGDFTIF